MTEAWGNLNHAMRDNYDQYGVDEVTLLSSLSVPRPADVTVLQKGLFELSQPLHAGHQKGARLSPASGLKLVLRSVGDLGIYEPMVGRRGALHVQRAGQRDGHRMQQVQSAGYGCWKVPLFSNPDYNLLTKEWRSDAVSFGLGFAGRVGNTRTTTAYPHAVPSS